MWWKKLLPPVWKIVVPKERNPFLGVREDVLLRYDHIILHCSASPPHIDLGATAVDRIHRGRGWKHGNGYHVFIKRAGLIQMDLLGDPCRPLSMHGAHVGDCGPGWNTRSLGVCYAGGVDASGKPTDNRTIDQKLAQAKIIQWFLQAHPKPWTIKIKGHRDLIHETGAPPKACPSFDVKDWLAKNQILDGFDFNGDLEDIAHAGEGKMALPATHTVAAGDTFWGISNTYGVPVETLKKLNHIRPDKIRPGQEIRLR
jgi:N-acetylmuramoyl-L-alanine amidase